MFLALQSAAAGLMSSANRVATAAQNVVVAAQSETSSTPPDSGNLSFGAAAYQRAAQGGTLTGGLPSRNWNFGASSLAVSQNPGPSIEESIVNLKIAAQAYKANAAVFRTVDKTMGALLAIKT